MRTPTHAPLSIEDIAVGDELPRLVKGPITTAHLVRWAAAMENWHRIHFDWRYATEHDGLPDVVVNGSWKQHVLMQLVTDWAGEAGWLWTDRLPVPGDQRARRNAHGVGAGDRPRATRRVRAGDARHRPHQRARRGEHPGTAVTVWPTREGPPVPYPFDPRVLGGDSRR